MYKLTENTAVDLEKEIAAVVTHLAANWTPIQGLERLVRTIQQQAFHLSRAWLDTHLVWQRINQERDARRAKLEGVLPTPEERSLCEGHDGICSALFYMGIRTGDLRDAGLSIDGRWDYSAATRRVLSTIAKEYPDLSAARPVGWEQLKAGYDDGEGLDTYRAEADQDAFSGADTAGAGSFNFIVRTSLPHVMYDDKDQGRRPTETLVGAVMAHFLRISEHTNTLAMLSALEELSLASAPAEVLFDFSLKTANPLLQALIVLGTEKVPSREEYARALEAARAFAALSEKEKAARRADNRKRVDEILTSVLKDEGADRRREQEKRHTVEVLKELLPATAATT